MPGRQTFEVSQTSKVFAGAATASLLPTRAVARRPPLIRLPNVAWPTNLKTRPAVHRDASLAE
jgi:hypothetical protein